MKAKLNLGQKSKLPTGVKKARIAGRTFKCYLNATLRTLCVAHKVSILHLFILKFLFSSSEPFGNITEKSERKAKFFSLFRQVSKDIGSRHYELPCSKVLCAYGASYFFGP